MPRSEYGVPLVRALRAHGERAALVVPEGRPVGYRELADRVDAMAARLGDRRRLVLVAADATVEPVVAYLAALRDGHPVVLAPPERVAALTDDYDPDVVVAPDEDGWDLRIRRDGSAHELHPELALLLGTSGSTGSPKLVRLSAGGVQANAAAIAEYLDIRDTDRAPAMLPLHYCYGLSVLHSNLLRGAAVVLTHRSVTEAAFWEAARVHGVTSLHGVPHTFDLLDHVGWPELPSLRYVTQAGGRLAPERVREVAERGRGRGWRFFVMYGQTEATARMAYLPPQLASTRPEAIGVPVPGGAFTIAPLDGDDDSAPAGPDDGGVTGELVYRGPNVMLGYAEGPADLAHGRTVEELSTGDLARRAPDGLYELIGRRSRFVKLFGHRVDLDDVERMLASDGVTVACAGDDAGLVLAVTDADPGPVAADVAARLGQPAGRVLAVRVPQLPRTAAGKIDYPAVVARGRAVPVPPADDASVHAVFARVLRRSEVAGDATFAELGGDSLTYVEMSLALADVLGRPPPDWPTRTVDELERERRAGARRGSPVETAILLRAASITLVVVAHVVPLGILGGAHLLVALAGWSFARFALAAESVSRRLLRTGCAIAVPTVLWIGYRAVVEDDISVRNMLLLNLVLDPAVRGYWFIESLLQIMAVLAVVLAVPAVRRWERHDPFRFALAALGVAVAVRVPTVPGNAFFDALFAPSQVFWIFVLGWLAHGATTTWRRVIVLVLLMLLLPGAGGTTVREVVVGAGIALLLVVDQVVVPRIVARAVGVIAGASLYIYLTHYAVLPALRAYLPAAAVVLACLAVGVGTWLVVEKGGRVLTRRRRRGRTGSGRRPQPDSGAPGDVSPDSGRRRTPDTDGRSRPADHDALVAELPDRGDETSS